MGGGEPDALNLFVIAGEESGDRLGAPLMAAIAAQAGRPVVFTGLGGREMAERGLDSLVPIADLAVNGFAAIPARLPTILRHLRTASRAAIAAPNTPMCRLTSPRRLPGSTSTSGGAASRRAASSRSGRSVASCSIKGWPT